MNMQLLIGAILRSVAIMARDPNIGDREDVGNVLTLTANILTGSPQLVQDLQALNEKLETLVAERRAFTPEERQALREESDRLSQRLAELAAERSNN